MADSEVNCNDEARIIKQDPKVEDRTLKMMVACVIFATVISVVGLLVAIVGISTKGSSTYYITASGDQGSSETAGDRIWMFQIGHYQSNTQYLDKESGTIKGYNVDVVNAVCQIANRNCELVYDDYGNCWDSKPGQRAGGGLGMMARWYDACVGWTHTIDRERTFRFSDEFEKVAVGGLWVKPGRTIASFPSLAGLQLGFVDGWSSDEHCLARYSDVLPGFDSTDVNYITHFTLESQLIAALHSGQIDIAYISVYPYLKDDPLLELYWESDKNRCILGGISIMMQKDQFELQSWWNAGFDRLKSTSQYEDICDRLSTAHGDQPGYDADFICVD